jgi:hypothetical protein
MKWKIVYITSEGVFFYGEEQLVECPNQARWFDDYRQAFEQAGKAAWLRLAGVVQVRLVSEAFEQFRSNI